jgi:uncharacterized repeat protein (TIGR01451 family)
MRALIGGLYILFLGLVSITVVPPVTAQEATTTCQPIFGGGETCTSSGNLIINKTVKHPTLDTYFDSLNPDALFNPGQDVVFRIVVTNDNNNAVSNVTITDYFPSGLTFTRGNGTFDTTNRMLTIKLDRLNGNETKNYTINARLEGADALPGNTPFTCLPNQAEVKSGNREATDNVQFCVKTGDGATQETASEQAPSSQFPATVTQQGQTAPATTPTTVPANTQSTTKGGVTVYPSPQTTQSPNTGPELLGFIGLLPAAAAGFYLRRKTTK